MATHGPKPAPAGNGGGLLVVTPLQSPATGIRYFNVGSQLLSLKGG